jgi:hypothetical protein
MLVLTSLCCLLVLIFFTRMISYKKRVQRMQKQEKLIHSLCVESDLWSLSSSININFCAILSFLLSALAIFSFHIRERVAYWSEITSFHFMLAKSDTEYMVDSTTAGPRPYNVELISDIFCILSYSLQHSKKFFEKKFLTKFILNYKQN